MTELAHEQYDVWRTMPNVEPLNPLTWEQFLTEPIFRMAIEGDYWVWGKDNFKEGGAPLSTPSGKVEFYSDYLANYSYSKLEHNTKTFGKGEITPLAKYRENPYSLNQPIAIEYPLVLLTPHSFYRQHFCQDDSLWFKDEYRNSVWLSVADAKARNIKDGDLISVCSSAGQSILSAYVTSRLTPGVACMIFGRQYAPSGIKTDLVPEGIDRAGSCNFLIPSEHFEARRGSLLCNAMVQVEKLDSVDTHPATSDRSE
jgi:anaerobic dimethyl sulfoxide reductase subunit A